MSQGSPGSSSAGLGAKAMGSGTRITNFCVTSQPTLLIASRKPNPRNRKSSARAGYLKRVMVTFAVYPRLFSHHFDIQSTTRKSHCHGYSRRLPALVVNHFDNQCSICLSPPKPKFNERFARPSTMVSLKCIFLSS